MPDSPDGHLIERHSVTEMSRRSASDQSHGIMAAEQRGRYVQDDAVDQVASEE
jgi:hypothetical protein